MLPERGTLSRCRFLPCTDTDDDTENHMPAFGVLCAVRRTESRGVWRGKEPCRSRVVVPPRSQAGSSPPRANRARAMPEAKRWQGHEVAESMIESAESDGGELSDLHGVASSSHRHVG